MKTYIQLFIVALIPVIFTVLFTYLEKTNYYSKMSYLSKQIIIGLIFGLIAIFGTEFGVDVGGATANARDAAPLCAGLIFGGPAGIIAGIIGGVERWFAIYWGAGLFSRVACSISTILAGLYAAFIRKYLFKKNTPNPIIGFFIGVIMEVIHLTILFVTNLQEPEKAFQIVKICGAPMIFINALGVFLSCLFIYIFNSYKLIKRTNLTISNKIQKRLVYIVMITIIVTTIFTSSIQTKFSINDTNSILSENIEDLKGEILDQTNNNLLNKTNTIVNKINKLGIGTNLKELCEQYDVHEINIVSNNGVIEFSSNDNYIGFDMKSGEQSDVFNILLKSSSVNTYVQEFTPISYDSNISMKYAAQKLGFLGYVQVGIDTEQYYNLVGENFENLALNRHIGNNGFVVITNHNNDIVSKSKNVEFELDNILNDVNSNKTINNKIFKSAYNGKECYCIYDNAEEYIIITVIPCDEIFLSRDMIIYITSFIQVIVFAVLFAFIYFMINNIVVKNINIINDKLSDITSGNLNVLFEVNETLEFDKLSGDINSTVSKLKEYIKEAETRIDKELEVAKNIQTSSLPSTFPAFPNKSEFDIYATMHTAKEVGGDFYDFYLVDENNLIFLIADVSGKGIPAAMFMMKAKTQIKSLAESGLPLDEIITLANNKLCEGNDAGMFVTLWIGKLNLNTGVLEYVNAGHNPPLIKNNQDQFVYLKSKVGFVLAGMEDFIYKKQEIQLYPNDKIFLYTDGVTEANDVDNNLYSEERLLNNINDSSSILKEFCINLLGDINSFMGEAPQFDDITMLYLTFNGPSTKIKTMPALIENIPEMTEFVENLLAEYECPMKTIVQFNIALDELLSNIANYSYPNKSGDFTVEVNFNKLTRVFSLTFVDSGIPFNPLKKEDPNVELEAENRDIGGLGIFMVKKSMDEMYYEYKNDKNIFTIVKKI